VRPVLLGIVMRHRLAGLDALAMPGHQMMVATALSDATENAARRHTPRRPSACSASIQELLVAIQGLCRATPACWAWRMLQPMTTVLICSVDPELSNLLTVNLERRGCVVHQQAWWSCCEWVRDEQHDADIVIADLDCPEPGCWAALPQLRASYPQQPLVLLGYAWSVPLRLQHLQPYSYLCKPFGIANLLEMLRSYIAFQTTPRHHLGTV
jgi:CheY-like chemotaxis protein